MTRERTIRRIIIDHNSTEAAKVIEDMLHRECATALKDLLCAMEDDCHESGYNSVVQEWVDSYIRGYEE